MQPMTHPREPLVRLSGVTKSYREGGRRRQVLEDISLELYGGERLALLGRSGAGKSTLLNLLGAIETPDSGRVIIAGRDLAAADERERTLFRRAHIGFVYQFFNLLPTLTVEENVRLPLELAGRPPARARERARALLARVGLEDRARAFPDQLSGGEQQRVAIARALAPEPVLILADEPTGNLDAETGRQALDLLGELSGAQRATLVLVTHSRQVAETADRILTLSAGRLRETGAELAW